METSCKEFLTAPAVFAVGYEYQIMVPVDSEMLFWVEIGNEKYYDHSNGILRSDTRVHRVSVPMTALDRAGEYTVCYRIITDRKPYYPDIDAPQRITYRFFPVNQEGKINIYHISDTHGDFSCSSETGTYFGENIDLLILNGDILDHSGSFENMLLVYRLCEVITHGEHPCVFSRGNHDLRGFFAERLADYFPSCDGRSYYTFRLGRIWGLVMDCAEDKLDSHEEYGGTVCCSAFRKEETEFLKKVIEKGEYLADGIDYRLVIVHNPFTYTLEPPFDIEQTLYQQWTDLLKNGIRPDLILAGHLHLTEVSRIGGAYDTKGQPCPVVIGSRTVKDEDGNVTDFIGCALTLDNGNMSVAFTDAAHHILHSEII